MIIENFDFEVLSGNRMIYKGSTYFGFFTPEALDQQIGLREAVYSPTDEDIANAQTVALPDEGPLVPEDTRPGYAYQCEGLKMPSKALRMIDSIEVLNPEGGPAKLGFLRASKTGRSRRMVFQGSFLPGSGLSRISGH